MRPAIILFAKAPVAGRVKTRLQPVYSPQQAVELHDAFVRDMVAVLEAVATVADLELHTDTPTDAWNDLNVARRLQSSGGLGARMLHALANGLEQGRRKVMIVGTDAPTLPAANLAWLLQADADVALGPVSDGGYYAIACRRVRPAMFEGVVWSGRETLSGTLAACRRSGLSTVSGPEWFDIDTTADLARLAASPVLPPHTREWFLKYADHLSAPGRKPVE